MYFDGYFLKETNFLFKPKEIDLGTDSQGQLEVEIPFKIKIPKMIERYPIIWK